MQVASANEADAHFQQQKELARQKKSEKLVAVRCGADGVVTYERADDAVGREVPQKAAQKYKNVPGRRHGGHFRR